MWYDAIGVPEDGRGLDYGFKQKVSKAYLSAKQCLHLHQQSAAADGVSEDEGVPPSLAGDDEVPDDAFLMVTQLPWENQIVWDSPYTPGPHATSIGEWERGGRSGEGERGGREGRGGEGGGRERGKARRYGYFVIDCCSRWSVDN